MATRSCIKSICVILMGLVLSATAARALEPTHSNVRYSDNYDRSVLDVWLPEGRKNAPIVIYFHGGGLVGGDKSKIRQKNEFLQLPKRGIAFASVNYPLIQGKARRTPEAVKDVLQETKLSIEFVRQRAGQFGIDPDKIILSGSSAGALIVQYLAYVENVEVDAVMALNHPRGGEFLFEFLDRNMDPLFLHTQSGPRDETHHPRNATALNKACAKVGGQCHLSGSKKSGLPLIQGGNFVDFVIRKTYSQ